MAVLEARHRTGDYRWNSGKRQFNLGLFRGLAGVGYTSLRQVDGSASQRYDLGIAGFFEAGIILRRDLRNTKFTEASRLRTMRSG